MRGISHRLKRVDGRHLGGQVRAAQAGQLGGQHQKVGAVLQRGEGPGEHQLHHQVVAGVDVLGQRHDLVLEGHEGAGFKVQREVEVEGTAAGRLRVEVDLEGLAHRVGLDEVPLVMHVEAVLGGMVFEIGDKTGDVDDGH